MAKRTQQFAEIADLADAVFDGTADAAARARLESLLLDSEPARAFYLDYTAVHADTAWERREKTAAPAKPRGAAKRTPGISDNPISAAGVPMYRKGYEPRPFKLRPHHFALAAAALLIAGLAVGLYSAVAYYQHQVELEKEQAAIAAARDAQPVATLIESTGNLTTPSGYPSDGRDYPRGEYTLSGGSAEFMLTNAVNVKLRGKSRMYMRNDMNVSLTHGSAAFVCPTDAKGFTVHLPDGSKVVDLGTAFRVKVQEQGRSSVAVTEGSVRVEHPAGEHRVFEAGERIAVTDKGLTSLAMELFSEDFQSGYTIGRLNGQKGWHAGDQIVVDDGAGNLIIAGGGQGTFLTKAYVVPAGTKTLELTARMKLTGSSDSDRSGSNLIGLSNGIDALIQFGADWQSTAFRFRDDSNASTVTNPADANALSATAAWYDVKITLDLSDLSSATADVEVRRHGVGFYTKVYDDQSLNLVERNQNLAAFSGVMVRAMTSKANSGIDDLSITIPLADDPAPAAVDTNTGESP